jgi:hypothetical protein
LVVNDGTVNSVPDSVTITAANSVPVANAGPDQSVSPGQTVTLNGSGSSDADGNALTYFWSFTARPVGSTATLNSPTTVMPSFVADVQGTYVVQLVVNDGTVNSVPDSVTITAVGFALLASGPQVDGSADGTGGSVESSPPSEQRFATIAGERVILGRNGDFPGHRHLRQF